MKQKVLGVLLVMVLTVGGCGNKETQESDKEPTNKEVTEEQVNNVEEEADIKDDANDVVIEPEEEKVVTIYYVDEESGDIVTKEATINGDLSEGIIAELKKSNTLSEKCDVQNVLVHEEEEKIDLEISQGFGDYIRSMGTSGEELILQCVVKSYQGAYGCDGVLITENGSPLDTGHTVLDGYISYE